MPLTELPAKVGSLNDAISAVVTPAPGLLMLLKALLVIVLREPPVVAPSLLRQTYSVVEPVAATVMFENVLPLLVSDADGGDVLSLK